MKVKFDPLDKEVEIDSNTSVLEAAKENGIQIKSVCGGLPSCAECRVQIKEGEYNVFPPGEEELALIGNAYFVDNSRLSCQLKCFGDVTIDMNEQIEKQKRGVSTKKPRGAKEQEARESYAVEGSIILDGKELEMFGAANPQYANEKLASMVEDERLEDAETAQAELRRIRERHKGKSESEDI
tara:strand:- start:3 stop:551 length:549 start_codon:yes stop_codon:yes gene_type:complete